MKRSLIAVAVAASLLSPPVRAASDSSRASAFGVYTSHKLQQQFMNAEGLDSQAMFRWSDGHIANLGAHWTRYSLLAPWQFIEPALGGGYNWSAATPSGSPDLTLAAVYASGNDIHAVINIQALSLGTGAPTRSPFTNPTEYRAFVTALAERYDGDGVADAPGGIEVDYFQLANEVQDWFDRGLTPAQYADAAQMTLEALRVANPGAQLVLMGAFDNRKGLLEDRYKTAILSCKQKGVQFAAVDLHWWFWADGASPWQSPTLIDARQYLDSQGLQQVEIWSMENAVAVGCPTNLPVISEEEQARILVKRYAWGRANGLSKLFWSQLLDYYNFDGKADSPFNSMGLVDDGEQNCSDRSRRNTPRSAYWAYKKLAANTDNLVATPAGTLTGVHDGKSLFAYDYLRGTDGAHVYVIWREGGAGQVSAPVSTRSARIVNLVADRFGTHQETLVTAQDGRVGFDAGVDPVLVLPSDECGADGAACPSTSSPPAGCGCRATGANGAALALLFAATSARAWRRRRT